MKKLLSIILTLSLMVGCIASCSAAGKQDDGRLKIVVTIFPEYDWVMNILGEKAGNTDVSLLMNTGTDLHSFQPTAKDIMGILEADLFIYVGGESDEWVEDVLKEAPQDFKTVNLLESIGDNLREEEALPGMDDEEEEEGDEIEYDEHIWLSLRNASLCCDKIASEIKALDSANSALYEKNLADYKARLDELDGRYSEAVARTPRDTILVADRFPFRYMIEDYKIKYYAAFAGCSAESEASFDKIIFLAGKIDELKLTTVLKIDGSDDRLAESIISNSGADGSSVKILTLNSMQSVTSADIESGTTYLGIMESNLGVLEQALM